MLEMGALRELFVRELDIKQGVYQVRTDRNQGEKQIPAGNVGG